MTRMLVLAAVCGAWLTFAPSARAQIPPFFNPQAALFDPEISVLTTGVLNDVQATVSADRKYVTLNMRQSNSELVALREFKFQTGSNRGNLPTGFAGDPAPVVAPPRGGGGGGGDDGSDGEGAEPAAARRGQEPAAAARQSQQPQRTASVLRKEGMTLVGRAPVPSASSARAGAP